MVGWRPSMQLDRKSARQLTWRPPRALAAWQNAHVGNYIDPWGTFILGFWEYLMFEPMYVYRRICLCLDMSDMYIYIYIHTYAQKWMERFIPRMTTFTEVVSECSPCSASETPWTLYFQYPDCRNKSATFYDIPVLFNIFGYLSTFKHTSYYYDYDIYIGIFARHIHTNICMT